MARREEGSGADCGKILYIISVFLDHKDIKETILIIHLRDSDLPGLLQYTPQGHILVAWQQLKKKYFWRKKRKHKNVGNKLPTTQIEKQKDDAPSFSSSYHQQQPQQRWPQLNEF